MITTMTQATGARQQRPQAAFTMIEIAISLAVIGFALVAIIGVLPTGLNVEKDNREDTIINQDGPYLLEGIRGGVHGLDSLTNYFDSITVITRDSAGGISTRIYTNTPVAGDWLTNGEVIIGLLGTPRLPLGIPGVTNEVTAHVRALTGSALEQSGANRAVALNYFLRSEIVPYTFFASDTTNWWAYLSTPNNPATCTTPDCITRSNRWLQAQALNTNLYEARLKFSWPLFPNGNIGPNRQIFRTLVSGKQDNVSANGQSVPNLFFFQPLKYTQADKP